MQVVDIHALDIYFDNYSVVLMPKVYYIVPQRSNSNNSHFQKVFFWRKHVFLSEKSGLAVFLSWSVCCSRFLEMLLQSCFKQFAAVLF
jgi:hypothetical protein